MLSSLICGGIVLMSMPSMLLQDAPLLGCVMWQLLPTLAKSGPHVCTRWLPFCHANSITIVTMHIWKTQARDSNMQICTKSDY